MERQEQGPAAGDLLPVSGEYGRGWGICGGSRGRGKPQKSRKK
nr:MAG: hypothetical protein [Bacteriophage sp.]